MIKYNSPYKERKYGYIKGDKKTGFEVRFTEGKFYKTDDGYVLMADVLGFMGVVKSFKPEEGLPMPVGMCTIPFYSKDYEIWDKKENKNIPVTPTLHEQNFCAHLDLTISEDQHYQGSITLFPDDKLTDLSDADISNLITKHAQLTEVTPSGNLLPYEVNGSSNGSYKKGGGSYKTSPKDKLVWLKTEIVSSIKDNGYNVEMSLIDLIDQVVSESEDENTLAIYVDFIKGCLS